MLARLVGLMARVRARHAAAACFRSIFFIGRRTRWGGDGRLAGWDVPNPGCRQWQSRGKSYCGSITTRVRVGVSRVGVANRRFWSGNVWARVGTSRFRPRFREGCAHRRSSSYVTRPATQASGPPLTESGGFRAPSVVARVAFNGYLIGSSADAAATHKLIKSDDVSPFQRAATRFNWLRTERWAALSLEVAAGGVRSV